MPPPLQTQPIIADDFLKYDSGDATPFNSGNEFQYKSYAATQRSAVATNDGAFRNDDNPFRCCTNNFGCGSWHGATINDGVYLRTADGGPFSIPVNGGSLPSVRNVRNRVSQAIDIVDPRTGEKIYL